MKTQKNTQSSGPRVAVTSTSFGKSAILRKELKRVFPNCYFNERGQPYSGTALIDFLKDADAAVVGTEPITDQVLSQANKLKIISKYGVGLDNIDQMSLKKKYRLRLDGRGKSKVCFRTYFMLYVRTL